MNEVSLESLYPNLDCPDIHYPHLDSPKNVTISEKEKEDIPWEKRHILLNPKWYEAKKVVRIIGAFFVSFTFFLTAGSILSGCFGIVPLSVSLGALAGFCSIVAAICFSKQKFWKDPQFLRKEGKKIEQEIINKALSYPEIQRYDARIWDPKYKNQDINLLLSKDITIVSFSAFYDKHGKEVFPLLDQKNLATLKPSFFSLLETIEENWSLIEKKYGSLFPLFDVQKENIKPAIILKQIEKLFQGKISYEEFIHYNGRNSFECLEKASLEKYHFRFASYLYRNNLGYDQSITLYQEALVAFNLSEEELIQATLKQDFSSFLEQKLTYLQFRNRNHPSIFFKLNEEEKNLLLSDTRPREEFFKQSYLTMTAEEFIEDRNFFSWEMDQIIYQIKTELRFLPYLNVGGFKEKHGLYPFYDLIFSKDDLAVVKDKLIEELKDQSYVLISRCKEEFSFFCLSNEEIASVIEKDFFTLSYEEMVQKHGIWIFFDEKIMNPSFEKAWHDKVKEFFNKIQRLEQIKNADLFLALPLKRDLEIFFQYKYLLIQYVKKEWKTIFIEQKFSLINRIQEYDRFPPSIELKLEETKQTFLDLLFLFNQKSYEIEQQHEANKKILKEEKEIQLKKLEIDLEIDLKKLNWEKISYQMENLEKEIQKKQQQIQTFSFSLYQTQEWENLNLELKNLENAKKDLTTLLEDALSIYEESQMIFDSRKELVLMEIRKEKNYLINQYEEEINQLQFWLESEEGSYIHQVWS